MFKVKAVVYKQNKQIVRIRFSATIMPIIKSNIDGKECDLWHLCIFKKVNNKGKESEKEPSTQTNLLKRLPIALASEVLYTQSKMKIHLLIYRFFFLLTIFYIPEQYQRHQNFKITHMVDMLNKKVSEMKHVHWTRLLQYQLLC